MINSSESEHKGKVIYLIRHARSVYNQAQAKVQKKYEQEMKKEGFLVQSTPEYLKMKFEDEHWDCDILSPIGQQQCKQCRNKMMNIPVQLVIVSPMRRALSTCNLVFKDHKSNPPIIVDPLFRQIFESICDIGSGLRQSVKDFPQFDYSLIQNVDYWYIESMKNVEESKKILQQLKNLPSKDQHERARQLMLQYIKQLWQRRQKDPNNKLQALSPIQLQKNKLKLLLQQYDSIAIVTHSQNIKSYTGIKPPNCSIMKYLPQYFQLPVEKVPHVYL